MTARRFSSRSTLLAIAFASVLAFAAMALSVGNASPAAMHSAISSVASGPVPGASIAATPAAAIASPVGNEVDIKGFAFQPGTLTVVAGSKVVWTNRDEEPHLVVSAGGQFPASPALDTDDRYAAVFTRPGTYVYFCSIHPHMVGTIVVK